MVYFPQHVFQLILSYNRRAPTARAIWKRVQQSTMGRVCHDQGNKEDWCKEKVKYILFRKLNAVLPGLNWNPDNIYHAKRAARTDCPRTAIQMWIERYYKLIHTHLRITSDRHYNQLIKGTPWSVSCFGPGVAIFSNDYRGKIKNMRKHLKENGIKRHSVAKRDELIKLCMSF